MQIIQFVMNSNVIKSSILYTESLEYDILYSELAMLTVYALYVDGSN